MTSYIELREGDTTQIVKLEGDKVGYAIDLASDIVRVWDKERTYLFHQRFLFLLQIENEKMRG